MSTQSPPKRITRARATANTGTDAKTARVTTAASRATAARNSSTTKRMAPVNDDQIEEISEQTEDLIEPKQPRPRGRPKKVVAAAPKPDVGEVAADPPKPTRGRPKKVHDAPALAPAPRPRGRPRKIDTAQTVAIGGAPKTTRTRTVTISNAAAPKKSVQFEQTDKENIIPAASNDKGKQKDAATGLRARPLRKPPVPARATRSQPKSTTQKSPLSPKKTTQIATGKDDFSDDELAGSGKTPTKSLAMSPVKPPAGVFTSNAVKKLDFSNSSTLNRTTAHDMSGSVMASPARRPPSSSIKESVVTSPKWSSVGDCLLRSPVKFPLPPAKLTDSNAPMTASMLRSPARRPPSPVKVSENGSPTRSGNNKWTRGATPNVNPFKISTFATPKILTKGAARAGQILGSDVHIHTPTPPGSSMDLEGAGDSSSFLSVPKFSGRLSSILPRDSDPAIPKSAEFEPEKESVESEVEIEQEEDAMVIDETITVVGAPVEVAYTNPFPLKTNTGSFGLREVDENPFQDSDSEDELGPESLNRSGFATPRRNFASSSALRTPFTAISKTPRTARSAAKTLDSRDPIGFTPLAKQLSDWIPGTPAEASPARDETHNAIVRMDAGTQQSPTENSYFDDAMSVSAPEQKIEEDDFSPVELDDEDYDLAEEADEMSLLQPDEIANIGSTDALAIYESENNQTAEGTTDQSINSREQTEGIAGGEHATPIGEHIDAVETEPTPSEASQEYGDENAAPIDPVLLGFDSQTPSTPKCVTPKRVVSERVFHTVSKVPLKGEAPASPIRKSPLKRRASVSKLPNQQSSNTLSRSNTVISYSPSKKACSRSPRKAAGTRGTCVTPSKDSSVDWSSIGTPARTPRRDLNPALLKGAVVFVDVHTAEGADASGLFIELLTQMGARSVKRWDWNGSKDDGSKIGITHVVFKDGGRRTLERAKQTGGVISCVGVGWVLDCERENKWLDESAYAVDIGVAPRGGQRRRKSMEPRALENHNGTLIRSTSTTPTHNTALQSPSKDTFGIPDTPLTSKSHRRDSTQWMHSPSSPSNGDYIDDETLLLSPIPATPAPEAIAAYGQDVFFGEETPSANKTPYYFHKEQLVQNTAPQGKRYFDESEGGSPGFLNQKKDESVMMRLMAARRKSLQWAPKVGSPLSQEGW